MRYGIAPVFSVSFNSVYFSLSECEAWMSEANGQFNCKRKSPGTFCLSDCHRPIWRLTGPVVMAEGLLLLRALLRQSLPQCSLPWVGGAPWKGLLAACQEECQVYRGGFALLSNMQARGLCYFPCLHSVSQWVHNVTSVSLRLPHSWVCTESPLPLYLKPEGKRTARGRINI